jgi:O-methyltransferase
MNLEEAIALGKSRSDCHPDNIDTLVRIVNELKNVPGDIVECGSYKAGSAIAMAAAARSVCCHSTIKKVYAFDLFGGLPYGVGAGFENFSNANYEEIESVTTQFPNIILVRGHHEETIPKFPNHPVSLLFMDSDFYTSHKVALEHFWPLLSSGGMVVFHDWKFEGVQTAIEYVLGPNTENVNHRYPESLNMGFIVKP